MPERRRPGELGDDDRLVSIAVASHLSAYQIDDLDDPVDRICRGAWIKREWVDRDLVEVSPGSSGVERLHLRPRGVRATANKRAGDDPCPSIRLVNCFVCSAQQRRVSLRPRLLDPEEIRGIL